MLENSDEVSAYYQHTRSVPFASRISLHVRTKMFRRFISVFAPTEADTVLDLGVTSDSTQQESNYFERLYPYLDRVTCVGTEDGSHLTRIYPGVKYQAVLPSKPLPFEDGEFDIVFSNAVLEHTGNRDLQAFFLSEAARVSRRGFFVTTPHRWFPIEHHTGLPLLHYLPAKSFQGLIRNTKYAYWSEESNLNILSPRDLSRILPGGMATRVEPVRLFGIPSNLVAYGEK